MKTIKILSILTLIALATSVFSACGKQQDSNNTKDDNTKQEITLPTEIQNGQIIPIITNSTRFIISDTNFKWIKYSDGTFNITCEGKVTATDIYPMQQYPSISLIIYGDSGTVIRKLDFNMIIASDYNVTYFYKIIECDQIKPLYSTIEVKTN